MSYFCGYQKLVSNLTYIVLLFSLLICGTLNLLAGVSMAAAAVVDDDEINSMNSPLSQLMSSREDMLQIAGYGEDKLSTVLITGSVHCEEACNHFNSYHHHHQHQQLLPLHAWPLSGALVSVNCNVGGRKGKSSLAEGFTDEFGDYMIDLPSHVHAIPNLDKRCSVRVVGIPKKTPCRPAYVKRHKGLKLSSVGNGIRTYSAGRIRFQHLTTSSSRPSSQTEAEAACIKQASKQAITITQSTKQ